MYQIKTINNIANSGLAQLPSSLYQIDTEHNDPDAILLRSQSLHDMSVGPRLKAIARAGAGTNNVPVEKMTTLGIPVFNTPGANANAVKELVLTSMLVSYRQLFQAWNDTRELRGEDIANRVEQLKKRYVGHELPGKTLGVIGLGAIGVKVANAAVALGMEVTAFDPQITIQNAWQLSAQVRQASSMQEVLPLADFLSIHVPYMPETHHIIDQQALAKMKKEAILLNFSRKDIVDTSAVLKALDSGALERYITDFPDEELLTSDKTHCLPHLGASTHESQENCAIMAANTLRRFLEHGSIEHSVNFPTVTMPRQAGCRITIVNQNVPNMLGQISQTIALAKVNIIDMINRSRNEIAYTLVDIEDSDTDALLQKLNAIEGVIRCRAIPGID